MFQVRSRRSFGALIVVALLFVFAHEMRGDVPTIGGKGKLAKEFRFGASLTGSSDNLLTVPAKRVFVVTDIQIVNLSSTLAQVAITRGGALKAVTPFFPVTQNQTFQHSYEIGPEIGPGETLQVLNFGGGLVSYFVSGYLRK